MRRDDETPHRLVGRAGLVFAYVCFLVAAASIAGAIYLLPATFAVKLFLGLAGFVLAAMVAFMALVTHLVMRVASKQSAKKERGGGLNIKEKAGSPTSGPDADSSHRPR